MAQLLVVEDDERIRTAVIGRCATAATP